LQITRYALRIATLSLLLLFLFFGMWIGSFVPAARYWTLEHLRLLDNSFAPEPASDLTAIFTRPAGARCEIRLDFLDLPDPPEYHFTVILRPSPNGRGAGDEGKVLVFSSDSPPPRDARLTVDAVTDIITLSLADCRPDADTPLIVATPAERLETPFGAQAEVQPVALQFVFYNTFTPAATPLQAWRRWDGAHTGPRGERHGLHGLLDTAEKHHIPLTLYETNTPATLSAIDAVGGTEQLRRMEKAGLLALPTDSAPIAPFWQFEISRNGLPLETRQLLLESVFPLTIGGDFQRSTWGTYEYAEPSLAWLAARPYFESTGLPVVSESTGLPVDSINYTKEMLSQSDPALAKNYIGLVAVLEAAMRWMENPAPVSECNDLCILASDKFYAVFSPRGGRLVFLFAGTEQIIGPTAQFFIGLSDRSQWDLSKGEAADPAQIMGAFSDADDAFRPYQAGITENSIRFISADGREKTYRLTETGLQATFSTPFETQIPLALAPQTRFTPGWATKYRLERLADEVRFGLAGGPMVKIQVSAGEVRALDSFLDAIPSLAFPENPNLELSPGFFLPFPLTVVHLSASQVSITVRP